MTQQIAIVDDPNYTPVLDHGFVGVVEVLGGDSAVCQAARVSYGAGTKSAREDRGLIRYLMRMGHTSPFEMTAIKLHLKAPIFVLRQLIRHRTHAANEYSARYSVMSDEFYLPEATALFGQSETNKQGRGVEIADHSKTGIQWLMSAAYKHSYDIYKTLLGPTDGFKREDHDVPYDAYGSENPLLDNDFHGVARELARIVLPVANYSEMYWQQSLHNMLHLIKLRADPHAQAEIRAYANAIYELIKPNFPLCCEAYEDYIGEATNLSRMEIQLTKDMFSSGQDCQWWLESQIARSGSLKNFAESRAMSVRELTEFLHRFDMKL
jgi:thymidylate synthase (FAD)